MSANPKPTAAEIYRDHRGYLWRVLLARGISRDDCPDLLHEIFETVMDLLPSYQEIGRIRTWLYAIADRHILGNFRSDGRRRRRMIRYEHVVCGHTSGAELDDHIARAEANLLVREFLHGLSEEDELIFVHYHVEHMTGPEISEILGVTLSKVYGRARTLFQLFHDFLQRAEHPRNRHE